MSFITSVLSWDNLSALDGSIRMIYDALLEIGAEVINSVGRPAMHVQRTAENERVSEGAFTTSEAWGEFVESLKKRWSTLEIDQSQQS